jgi:hypothetical protein
VVGEDRDEAAGEVGVAGEDEGEVGVGGQDVEALAVWVVGLELELPQGVVVGADARGFLEDCGITVVVVKAGPGGACRGIQGDTGGVFQAFQERVIR